MKDKKIPLLAGMAALAVVAVALPAAASESEWQHEGAPLEKHVELALSGGEVFEIGEGDGMGCGAQATLTTEGGGTGKVTAFVVSKEGCFGFGEFTKCKLVSASPQGLPWTVDVNAEDLTITGGKIVRKFDSECPVEELESTVAEIDTTLYSPTAITELEFSGEGNAHPKPGTTVGYKTFGSLQVEGENAGTYGIG